MDSMEKHILEHEAGVRQGFLEERLEKMERYIHGLREGLTAVSNPSEKMKDFPMEKRLRYREAALMQISNGTPARMATDMCDDASSMQNFLGLVNVFTKREWEKEK